MAEDFEGLKKYADGGRAKKIADGGSDGGKDASSWKMPMAPGWPTGETFATVKEATLERPVGGKTARARLDKYARGGKVKGKTNVTVIVAPQGGGARPPMAPPMPPPVIARPPVAPPMAGPPMPPGGVNPGMMPGGPPMGAPPGVPGGMPMRKKGGRIKRWNGGPVRKDGAGSGMGRLENKRKQSPKGKPLPGESGT